MPDGSHSPDAPITIHVDGDIKALPFIADLKRAGLRLVTEGGRTFLRRSSERSRPMEVVNDVAAVIDQLLGLADLLTSIEAEDLCEGTIAKTGYAIENLLKQAADRLAEARDDQHAQKCAPSQVEAQENAAQTEDEKPTDTDRWHASSVRAFLASVRPLRGVCFCDSKPFYDGQAAIEQLASAIESKREQALPDIHDCADMLFYLANIQPLDEGCCFGHGGEAQSVGFNEVLDHIRETIEALHEKND